MNELEKIDNAFKKTTKMLLGEELGSVVQYENWLMKRIPKGKKYNSTTSEKQIYVPDYSLFKNIPKDKIADLDSFNEITKQNIMVNQNDDLRTLGNKMESIAKYITESINGQNENVIESTIYSNLFHAYKTVDSLNSKYLSHGFWNANCEHLFGSCRNGSVNFGIHCYTSKNVNMGFEIDCCGDSTNIMFCHNCINTHDSMFCFNTKNKRFAIANIEVGEEVYSEAKTMFLEYLVEKLKKDKYIQLDIFNIACKQISEKIGKINPMSEEIIM